MLALELFKRRLFSIGSSASFLGFLGGASVFFLMPFYLQEVLGYSAGEAGLIIAPSALCMGLAGPIAGRLSDKYGWRRFSILGLVIFGAALLLLSQAERDRSTLAGYVGAGHAGRGHGDLLLTHRPARC